MTTLRKTARLALSALSWTFALLSLIAALFSIRGQRRLDLFEAQWRSAASNSGVDQRGVHARLYSAGGFIALTAARIEGEAVHFDLRSSSEDDVAKASAAFERGYADPSGVPGCIARFPGLRLFKESAPPFWYVTVLCKAWLVVLALALLPLARLAGYVGHRRTMRRRKDAGLCSHCGYDLRATRDRCPECGTVPTTAG
jgi:hypothetical protein